MKPTKEQLSEYFRGLQELSIKSPNRDNSTRKYSEMQFFSVLSRLKKKYPTPKKLSEYYKKRWLKKNPQKVIAWKIYKKALDNGTLKKKPCKKCGNKKVDGHHPNYFEPLKVVWLCRKHHTEHHTKERRHLSTH